MTTQELLLDYYEPNHAARYIIASWVPRSVERIDSDDVSKLRLKMRCHK